MCRGPGRGDSHLLDIAREQVISFAPDDAFERTMSLPVPARRPQQAREPPGLRPAPSSHQPVERRERLQRRRDGAGELQLHAPPLDKTIRGIIRPQSGSLMSSKNVLREVRQHLKDTIKPKLPTRGASSRRSRRPPSSHRPAVYVEFRRSPTRWQASRWPRVASPHRSSWPSSSPKRPAPERRTTPTPRPQPHPGARQQRPALLGTIRHQAPAGLRQLGWRIPVTVLTSTVPTPPRTEEPIMAVVLNKTFLHQATLDIGADTYTSAFRDPAIVPTTPRCPSWTLPATASPSPARHHTCSPRRCTRTGRAPAWPRRGWPLRGRSRPSSTSSRCAGHLHNHRDHQARAGRWRLPTRRRVAHQPARRG